MDGGTVSETGEAAGDTDEPRDDEDNNEIEGGFEYSSVSTSIEGSLDPTTTPGEWEWQDEDSSTGIPAELTAEPPVKQEILQDVTEHFQAISVDDSFAGVPSTEFVASNFFDFGYLEETEIVEWRWVNEPYSYITIVRRDEESNPRYLVHEPVLDDFERYVHDDLVKLLRNSLLYEDIEESDDREAVFERKAEELILEHAAETVEDGTLRKLKYYLLRDFVRLGPIDPLMHDPAIEDISCDGIGIPLYVYHFEYRDLQTNLTLNEQELNSFTLQLAQRSGEQVSVSEPLVDGTLPDGSRVQLTFGDDIATRGSNFTIRKFANVPLTPIDLIQHGTFTVEQMAYFWLAIESNRSLIFSGGTGSGKTTSMNAVSMFIPEDSKVVSIEDTREITLSHDNWIPSLTRESTASGGRGEVSMYELLQAALRQRPEYIIVGEIRTEQKVAFTFFQAIGTGHTAYTTIHAESVEGVLNRLENAPLSVPTQMILELDIVSIQSQSFKDDDRVRRNEVVTEILPGSDGEDGVRVIDVFERNAEEDDIHRVNSSHVLQEIANDRGWSDRQLAEELQERREFLQTLIEEDVSGYNEVAAAIRAFGTDREAVLTESSTDGRPIADPEGKP